MQVYVGGDNHLSTRDWLAKVGFGQMKSPNGWQPPFRGISWALDNGAFTVFLANRAGTVRARYETAMAPRFEALLERVEARRYRLPDFAILPDIVGSRSSLALSLRWIGRLPRCVPAYLAVQDGMTVAKVDQVLRDHSGTIQGLFVGGSIAWKDLTAGSWANLAHGHGLKCHVGRVGTKERILAMLQAGIDSIDSTSWRRHRSHWHVRDAFVAHWQATGEHAALARRLARVKLPA